MDHAATYPTDVKTLHFMLDEQRALIESLKANLRRLLRWQFGPTSEYINVDQLGLFVDGSVVVDVWDALTNFTKAGHLEASNNYAERCMRPVAVGRKAFLFVGSGRAGHAAAIYYSLVESCKASKVNPLTYLTYVLGNARNKSITLPTPDEFTASNIAHVG